MPVEETDTIRENFKRVSATRRFYIYDGLQHLQRYRSLLDFTPLRRIHIGISEEHPRFNVCFSMTLTVMVENFPRMTRIFNYY